MKPGDRIKAERKAQEMERAELARMAGMPYATLAGIENGDQGSSTKLHAIAAALGLNPSWIETGKGPKFATDAPSASHPARPDPKILLSTQEFLETAYALQGKVFDLRSDADLFADAYEWLAEDSRPVDQRNLVDFGRWLAARQQANEATEDGQQSASPIGQATGTNRRRAAKGKVTATASDKRA